MGTFFPTTKTSKIHRFFNSLRCLAEMGEWHVERGALLKNVTQPFLDPCMVYTPEDKRLEPKNHPIEKENHLQKTIIFRFHVILPGCIYPRLVVF